MNVFPPHIYYGISRYRGNTCGELAQHSRDQRTIEIQFLCSTLSVTDTLELPMFQYRNNVKQEYSSGQLGQH